MRRYYYYSYMSPDAFFTGCQLYTAKGPFNLATVHRFLANQNKATCIVISWQEISAEQFAEFEEYCTSVNGGDALPKKARVLDLVGAADEANDAG